MGVAGWRVAFGAAWIAVLVLPAAPLRADLADVKRRGVLRMLSVVVADEPEFVAEHGGDRPGFDREVLEGFARLHKLGLELQRVESWAALIPSLVGAKGDLIAGRFTATDSRRRLIDFTTEVFPTRNVAVTRHPRGAVTSLAALRGETIGIVKGTSMADVLAASGVPAASIVADIPSGGAFAALRSGRVTCTIDEVAGAIMAKRADPDLQIGMFLGPPASYAYGVRKEDRQLRAALNDYIDNLRRTPTWNRLVLKYFGDSAPEILRKARTQ
jgi:ABC-type amino acid transport substrate-binding protein